VLSNSSDSKVYSDGGSQGSQHQLPGTLLCMLETRTEFVFGGMLTTVLGAKSGYKHDSKNGQNSEHFVLTHILLHLEIYSFIVMNNASYHGALLEKLQHSAGEGTRYLLGCNSRQFPSQRQLLTLNYHVTSQPASPNLIYRYL